MKVLNIGCGLDKYAGNRLDAPLNPKWNVVGLDKQNLDGVDVVHDLNILPLPFKDNEFDMVFGRYIIEYISEATQLIVEIHRILKPNATLKLIVAHHTNPYAYLSQHQKYWNMLSLGHLDNPKKPISNLFKLSKKIKLVRPFRCFEPIANRFPNFYEWRLSWLIPAIDIHFTLQAVKKNVVVEKR